MHWFIRAISLFLITVLAEMFVLWWASAIGHFDFPFWEGAKISPIFSVAMLYTVYSMMLPAANWAANGAEWGDNAAFVTFLATSIFLVPLLIAFPPPEKKLAAIFMSNTEYMALFFAAWFVQGGINAIHVYRLVRGEHA